MRKNLTKFVVALLALMTVFMVLPACKDLTESPKWEIWYARYKRPEIRLANGVEGPVVGWGLGEDYATALLAETFPGSGIYEGQIQIKTLTLMPFSTADWKMYDGHSDCSATRVGEYLWLGPSLSELNEIRITRPLCGVEHSGYADVRVDNDKHMTQPTASATTF